MKKQRIRARPKRQASKAMPHPVRWLRQQAVDYWTGGWWHKAVIVLFLMIGLTVGTMYGIARWYIWQERGKPLELGITFVADYASALGLNPHQTLTAMLGDLGVRHIRLVSHWDDIEPRPGKYNFSELDWEFRAANAAHATVTLSIGLRQPRWPECHPPAWVDTRQPVAVWQPQVEQFMAAVINRYKTNPALRSYQLENEYFLKAFGLCTDFSRDRLVSEYNLAKQLDPQHPVIVARSNNAIGTPIGQPTPDEYGFSVYKRVWDKTITHRYLEYPFPAWYYAFLAGTEKIMTGRDTMIHELQAEPWPPNDQWIGDASVAEQDKSMNADILKRRIRYGEATGMKQIYLWGAEWWYWRLVKAHDPSLWNAAKQAFQTTN
jgi:hypothetical protein